MVKDNLLLELGTEELPPKALRKLAQALADNLSAGLQKADLGFEGLTWYASPRRLAVIVNQLASKQADKEVEKRGPAVTAAFAEDGSPTPAAQGWARSNGITIEQASRLKTDKGEWLLHKATVAGKTINSLIEGLVNEAVSKLPIPKPMRWGDSDTRFIRPVHSVTLLYGSEILPATILGKTTGRQVSGHRFHSKGTFAVESSDSYLQQLQEHYVIADYEQRKQLVSDGLNKKAKSVGAVIQQDDALIEEVTSLVEWPVILMAEFDTGFLNVPKEALIYTMKDDQKYFPLLDDKGALLPRFLFVTNIESKDPKQVIAGNEKVIRPRLADAEFFYKTDLKTTLASRIDSLDTILFQKQLGTLKDKSVRVATLAKQIAEKLNVSPELAYRAGELAKTDLMSAMVMEFPEVQGVMGRYYALADGEDPAVAQALLDQYKPRFAGDTVPTEGVSCALALADKIDTIVGIFGIGQLPKGDKDPFALRRAANGILRICNENSLDIDLAWLISIALEVNQSAISNAQTEQQVLDFILARLTSGYQDSGVDARLLQAIMACKPSRPVDFAQRVAALTEFMQLDAAQALAEANKRVANILAKNNVVDGQSVQTSLFQQEEEHHLFEALNGHLSFVANSANLSYEQQLQSLAKLREPIDAFFVNVKVMSDEVSVKENRLALLLALRQAFTTIADISLLQA